MAHDELDRSGIYDDLAAMAALLERAYARMRSLESAVSMPCDGVGGGPEEVFGRNEIVSAALIARADGHTAHDVILDLLKRAGRPLLTIEIAGATRINKNTVTHRMWAMKNQGLVVNRGSPRRARWELLDKTGNGESDGS